MYRLNLDAQEIKRLYEQGVTTRAIAERMGCSATAIKRRLHDINYTLRHGPEKAIDLDLIKQLYLDKKSITEIAERLKVSSTVVHNRLERLGLYNKNELTKNYRFPNSSGYILVKRSSHPRANKYGYVLEHLLVWEEHHKRPLPEGWHIHHLNGIRDDNRPLNLVALSPVKHKLNHNRLLEERAKRIRELEIGNRQLRFALENSQMILYINEN